jgi:hypothetical protein
MKTSESGDYSIRVVKQGGDIAEVEVTFHDDGSRWRSNFATTDRAAIEQLVRSLLEQGEFDSAFDPMDA